MEQVAELLGVMFTLRVVSMNLDENDIPFPLLENAQALWETSAAMLRTMNGDGQAVAPTSIKPCTFVQRPGIALYNRGAGKKHPIWKRGITDVLSIIDFVRENCTVTFDFSSNSYFRLKFDMIQYRDNLLKASRHLIKSRESDCMFLKDIAKKKIKEEKRARKLGLASALSEPEKIGPDGEPIPPPGSGKALFKFVSTVYTDTDSTARQLQVGPLRGDCAGFTRYFRDVVLFYVHRPVSTVSKRICKAFTHTR